MVDKAIESIVSGVLGDGAGMVGDLVEGIKHIASTRPVSLQEPEDPKGPQQGVYRVLRGGCWKSLKEDLRCSHRHRNNPGAVNSTYGFRCVANVS